jgi:uncharacterized membrane protein (UPF0127 family)
MNKLWAGLGTILPPKQWVFILAFVLLGAGGFLLTTHAFSDEPTFAHTKIDIQTAEGKTLAYDMELAITPEQREYGLMFRRSIDDNQGMIFLWDKNRPVSMWMKNTYIPLDMLYVRSDGVIEKIITNAEPFNLTPLSSDQPVKAVIELKGGAVTQQGLKTGDKVLYSAFSSGH